MSIPYIPLYVADFEADTTHLSFEEDGAYNRLLRLCWRTPGCSIPDDADWIISRMRCDLETFDRVVYPVLSEFFKRQRGRYFSARLVAEFERINSTQKKRSSAGKLGGRPPKTLINKETDESRALTKQKHLEPELEPDIETTLSSVVSAPPQADFDLLQSKLLEAVGEGKIHAHGSIVVGPIVEMIAAGVDLETDILPTIRAKAGKMTSPANSWSFFVAAIRDAYERRIAAGKGLSKPKAVATDNAAWIKRLRYARQCHMWSEAEHGPPPGAAGCQVPKHLIQAGDGVGWVDFAAAKSRVAA